MNCQEYGNMIHFVTANAFRHDYIVGSWYKYKKPQDLYNIVIHCLND